MAQPYPRFTLQGTWYGVGVDLEKVDKETGKKEVIDDCLTLIITGTGAWVVLPKTKTRIASAQVPDETTDFRIDLEQLQLQALRNIARLVGTLDNRISEEEAVKRADQLLADLRDGKPADCYRFDID